jgi:hypothetical protein
LVTKSALICRFYFGLSRLRRLPKGGVDRMTTALERLRNLGNGHAALLQHLNLAVLGGRQLRTSAAIPGEGVCY